MITREQFIRFEELRTLGEYNMIAEYEQVIEELDMTEEEYNELLSDYDELRERYIDGR